MGGGSRRGQTLGPSLDDLLLARSKAHRRGDLATRSRRVAKCSPPMSRSRGAVQILGAVLAERGEVEPAVELFVAAAARRSPTSTTTYGFYNNYAERAAAHASATAKPSRSCARLVAVAPTRVAALAQPRPGAEGPPSGSTKRSAPLRRAVALAPEHGPNHAVLGEVLYQLGRLRSADASLRRCIELGWDTDVNLWTILGNNHRMLGELPEAIECLERAFELSQRLVRTRTATSESCSRRSAASTKRSSTSARPIKLEPDTTPHAQQRGLRDC